MLARAEGVVGILRAVVQAPLAPVPPQAAPPPPAADRDQKEWMTPDEVGAEIGKDRGAAYRLLRKAAFCGTRKKLNRRTLLVNREGFMRCLREHGA
jgi:hypothetical protein